MGDDELERRLAELTRQEAAFRRVVADVEAGRPVDGVPEEELAAAKTRADEAEVRAEAAARRADEAVARAERAETQIGKVEAQADVERIRVAENEARAQAAEARVRELETQVEELARLPEPVEVPEPPVADTIEAEEDEPGSIMTLIEQAIADAHARGAPEAEEWAFYLPLLREHARPDGSLPPEFGELVESVFGDL